MLVPAGVPQLTVDWTQMTTNCLGNNYDGSQITEAAVAHYTSKTLPELQRTSSTWKASPTAGGRER